MEETIRPLTDDDLARLAGHEAAVLDLLRGRYGVEALEHGEGDLQWLQRLLDDGVLGPDHTDELYAVGVVFGQALAAQTPLRWITVELDGRRTLALRYPGTAVMVFPTSMIAKRVTGGREVDCRGLFAAVAAQVGRMKDDPRYRRDHGWVSPVGDPDTIDMIAARHDGGVELILVVSRPLDDSNATRGAWTRKLRNYCRYAASPEFAAEFGPPAPDRVTIVVRSDWEVPEPFLELTAKTAAEEQPPVGLAVKYE